MLNLGTAETKLLYTLHWILLDAAEVSLVLIRQPAIVFFFQL